ncbi:alginate lyase family protein [Neobacillus mesonae]|uniref:alginate lyase family protein n=1 Tax=Neobacillus mesonae TaxID=1193713 RepID=UPI000A036FE2|nr:alginate lyase family protein [Neobacillus mesonae]
MINKFLYQYKYAKGKYKFNEVLKKISQKIYNQLYHSLSAKILDKRPIDFPNSKFKDFTPNENFFFKVTNKDYYTHTLRSLKIEKEIIYQAEQICEHIFDLLGSGKKSLGEKINWHQDFKTGFTWPQEYFKKIKTVDLSNNSDVKVPWELSRFQHIPTLGQAYWLTGNEKYAIEFMSQIDDWIKENPVAIGVNWTCTMDVSIRNINWIIGSYYFKNSKVLSSDFWVMFYKHLYLSGRFIINNLERLVNGHGNNHYLSNLVGLTWLGIFFNGFDKHSKKWLDKGVKGLIKEMDYQVNSEGTDFEASIPYHRLVTELFLSTTILAESNGITFPKVYMDKLEKMCEFIMHYTKDNGLAPQIGDADNGRLHILSRFGTEEKRDHRHILGVAGEYFDRNDFRYFAGSERIDALWLFGEIKDYSYLQEKNLISKIYAEMGYYLIRDERIYLLIRCGSVWKPGIEGHNHNDQLSIELQIDGRDIFIDPGTFVYTSDFEQRNLFRGTGYHNTLQVNNSEQHQIEERQLFRILNNANTKLIKFEQNDDEVIFIGEHDGFEKEYGIIHRREIIYNFINKTLFIKDSVNKFNESKLNWILNENLELRKINNRHIILNDHIEVVFDNDISITETFISPSYGVKVQSNKISTTLSEGNLCYTTFIKF